MLKLWITFSDFGVWWNFCDLEGYSEQCLKTAFVHSLWKFVKTERKLINDFGDFNWKFGIRMVGIGAGFSQLDEKHVDYKSKQIVFPFLMGRKCHTT